MRITVGTFKASPKLAGRLGMCVNSGRISQGENVALFEKQFAEYHSIKHCVAVSSGTDADTLAWAYLQDWKHYKGLEVILPALTFVSCANSIMQAGFKAQFVDVDPVTYTLNPALIDITPKTIGIMPVHLFGRPADMDAIREHNFKYIIEDCAEAHGSRYKGQLVGTFGDVGTFSFYIAHTITSGEGGAIITNNSVIAGALRSLRAHGRDCSCEKCVLNISSTMCPKRFKDGGDSRFHFSRVGFSAKMNEMEALVGLDQIDRFQEIVNARCYNMDYLIKHLLKYDEFQLMVEKSYEQISPLAFPIVLTDKAKFSRSDITSYLEKNGIETRPMFSSIPTQEPAYEFLGYRKGQFPVAEKIGERGFYIGVHQNLTIGDLIYILNTFKHFMKD